MPDSPLVTVETTAGDLVLELAATAAPVTVGNFLHYVRSGFYAGTVFHRVIPRFVAQAGGYERDRSQKAPLRPPIPVESSGLKHTDGALGMARLAEPATSATSEFYLCDGAQRDLDGSYCVFGRLVDGRDTLRNIVSSPTRDDNWPLEPPVILRAYEGRPDAANPARKVELADAQDHEDAVAVREAARRLRGKAALLRSRRPLMSFGDLEAAIAEAQRTGKRAALEKAEKMLAERERRK